MKKLHLGIMLCILAFTTTSLIKKDGKTLTANFVTGNPEIASINTMSFGPEGILFIGDSKNATIYALDTKDVDKKQQGTKANIGEFDKKIAASLGTNVSNIKITDMAVNPISKSVYFSVNTADGTPVLLKLNGENFESISLTNASFSKIGLTNAVATDKKDRRGRSQRVWAISDLKYHDGKVMVSGLSNKEFSSTFRSIPFPFKDTQDFASLEIYHAAHGKYETHAPIKTFSIINMDNTDYVLASYTCTPLVLFPLNDLKNGKHTKGRTVAELGAGNSPIDMISLEKEGKPYFVMTNTNRSAMRIDYETIANFKESLTEPVTEFAVATGVNYVSLPMVNVLQIDNLDKENVIYMQRTASGELILRSRPTRWM